MLKIYYSFFENPQILPVACLQRNEEINGCKNLKTRTQKYAVWKLLEYAIFDSFGKTAEETVFSKSKNGKWTSNICHFSLSHSENAIAVAISNSPVGIDVERIRTLPSGIESKILSTSEIEEFSTTPILEKNAYLIRKWTEKESYFKSLDKKTRSIINDNTLDKTFTHHLAIIDGEEYFISVFATANEQATIIKV